MAATAFSEGIRFLSAQETQQAPVVAQQVQETPPVTPRGPTLEATNGSKIDASHATIPGDLPFQFGKADGGSLIEMPGINVTKTEKGWEINTAANTNREFPPPPEYLATMSLPELKAVMQANVAELRDLQRQFDNDFFEPGHKYPEREKAAAVYEKYKAIYNKDFSQKSLDLASAALIRIGSVSNLSRDANLGGQVVYHKMFVGPRPAEVAALFLETLLTNLPNG
jgi:hypothetical protein